MNTSVEVFLRLFTFFSKLYDTVSEYMYITKQGIYDAHTPSKWIFSTANTYPCFVNDSWNLYSLTPRVYYPATNKFYVTDANSKITLDIVTANITGPIEHDMSSFLYKVSWSSEYYPPSLYEIVLVYLATEKIYVSYDVLDTCTLTVLTSDAEEITINLGSYHAKKPFRKWDMLTISSNSSTSSTNTSSNDLKID